MDKAPHVYSTVMDLDAFTARLGISQGRMVPINGVANSGDFAFVLGDDEVGRFTDLAPGDFAEISQSVDLTGQTLIRVNLKLRVPKSLDTGLAWETSILIDGVKQSKFICTARRERIATDMAANVSKLTGIHQVGIRLELVEV